MKSFLIALAALSLSSCVIVQTPTKITCQWRGTLHGPR